MAAWRGKERSDVSRESRTCASHVDQLNAGELRFPHASGQSKESKLSLLSVEVTFQRGGGAAEHNGDSGEPGAPDRHVAGVVARSEVVLFIGMLVLFVDDDEAEIGKRREDGGACADENAHLAPLDPPPEIVFLAPGSGESGRPPRVGRTGSENAQRPGG